MDHRFVTDVDIAFEAKIDIDIAGSEFESAEFESAESAESADDV